jgi:hypothetical protein
LGGGSGEVGAFGDAHDAAELDLSDTVLLGDGREVGRASLGTLALTSFALGLHKVVHGVPQFVLGGAQFGGGGGQVWTLEGLVGNAEGVS